MSLLIQIEDFLRDFCKINIHFVPDSSESSMKSTSRNWIMQSASIEWVAVSSLFPNSALASPKLFVDNGN